MIQAYLHTDNVESTPSSQATNKGFKELLKFAQECLAEDSCEQEEDVDALLIALLNLLNIPIDFQDTVLRENLHENLETGSRLVDMLSDSDTLEDTELSSLLQELLTEFKDTGHIKPANIDKFYHTLKAKIPEVEQVDIDTFEAGVKELLETQSDGISKSVAVKSDVDYEGLNIKPKAKHREEVEKHSHETKGEKEPYETTHHNEKGNTSFLQDNSMKVEPRDDIWSNYSNLISVEDAQIQPVETSKINHTPELLELKDESMVFDQIVDKVKLLVMGENQQINIRLKPEHLGQVLVKVFAERDRLRAEFFVGNTQVKEMLNVHAQDFKNQIQEQGYNFSDISVYDLSDNLNNGSFNHNFQDENNNSQYKKPKYAFRGDEGDLNEISTDNYYDPWQSVSNVDFRA